jgi:hypothetical protein
VVALGVGTVGFGVLGAVVALGVGTVGFAVLVEGVAVGDGVEVGSLSCR